MADLLKIDDFSLSLKGSDGRTLPVLENVSLSLAGGECLGIAGESGSGKSVLAMSIVGLIPRSIVDSSSGKIFLGDEELTNISEKVLQKIRGSRVGFIFQEPMTAMNPLMNLYDQIAETVYAHCQKIATSKVEEKVKAALLKAGFTEPEKFYRSYPHQLSGGMRQRAMIAMAMVLEPELVIADEPTTAIDAGIQVQLLGNLRRQMQANKHSMIFISHDLGVLQTISDKIAILYCGHLIESGNTKDVLKSPRHPYTADLIAALPRLVVERLMPKPIAGTMPSPDQKPAGCVYFDRCSRAKEKCSQSVPELAANDGARLVRCFYPITEAKT